MIDDPTRSVHARDEWRIERILELIDEASRPRPLTEVLGALCSEVAAIVGVPVASVYVRDEQIDDMLVMRANVGFPGQAIDQVKLRIGEGITGYAAARMRPVTLHAAAADEHFKAVDGLDEADFPIFLALPILVGHRTEAVLVLQREAGRPFADHEVLLATSLSTTFAYALERARGPRDALEEAPKKAHLPGVSRSPGQALGRLETVPALEGLAAVSRARGLSGLPVTERQARLSVAFDATAKELERTIAGLRDTLPPQAESEVEGLRLLWMDQRLRAALDAQAAENDCMVMALRGLARIYARAPYEAGHVDPSSTGRSVEVEALCVQVAGRLVDERIPTSGAALSTTDRLPAILVLAAVAHRAAAIAVGGSIPEGSLSIALARAAKMPVLVGVGGLFAWARSGDRVIVDADHGVLRVNPSAATVAELRRGER